MLRNALPRYVPWLTTFAGILALVLLVGTIYPTPVTKVLFLALLFMTSFGGFVLLLRGFYMWRLPARMQSRDPRRALREALFAAFFLTTCAWLQMLRLLTLSNALLLLGVLALVEAFWLSRKQG